MADGSGLLTPEEKRFRDELAGRVQAAIVGAVQDSSPDPAHTDPAPVMGALAMVSGKLLAQLRNTPNAYEQFCGLVQQHMVEARGHGAN